MMSDEITQTQLLFNFSFISQMQFAISGYSFMSFEASKKPIQQLNSVLWNLDIVLDKKQVLHGSLENRK